MPSAHVTMYILVITNLFLWFQNIKQSLQPAAARSRSRSNIAQEGEAEASSQEALQELMPEEVLVISIGSGPQTVPGMMSENEVMNTSGINGFTWRDKFTHASPAVTKTEWASVVLMCILLCFMVAGWATAKRSV